MAVLSGGICSSRSRNASVSFANSLDESLPGAPKRGDRFVEFVVHDLLVDRVDPINQRGVFGAALLSKYCPSFAALAVLLK